MKLMFLVWTFLVTALIFAAGPATAKQEPKSEPLVEPVESGPSPETEPSASAAIDPPVDVKLPNVRWQPLPDGIVSAAVSPDQRIWYLMGGDAGPREMTQAAIRQVLEREFAKPSPQLQGVSHLFFESEGVDADRRAKVKRVWLICPSLSKRLLGYDGKQWIERRMKRGFFARGDSIRQSFLQFDGGTAFFESGGCHILTGSNWIFHKLGVTSTSYTFRAWREADGKGLVVWVSGDTASQLWRFREGTWSDSPWPKDRYAAARVRSPVKLGDHFYARLGFHTDTLTPPQRASMVRSRLLPEKPLVVRIGPDGQAEELDPEKNLTVGRYQIPLSSAMWNDAEGAFYAGCASASVGGSDLGAGLLICDPTGKEARYVAVEKGSPVDVAALGTTPLFLNGGKQAWTAQGLLDLEHLTRIAQLPSEVYEVVAATSDGTAFAERSGRRAGVKKAPAMVFRLDAAEVADTRIHLAEEIVWLNSPGHCISGDGSIWASRGEFGLERFDGKAWHDADTVKRDNVNLLIRLTPFTLVPGQNGWVLAFVGHRVSDLHIERGVIDKPVFHPSYLLLDGKRCNGGRSFATWISHSRDLFLDAFSSPSLHASWRAFRPMIAQQYSNGTVQIAHTEVSPLAVVVDKSKNLWVMSSGSVCVASENCAIDLSLPGKLADNVGRVTQMVSLGDGQSVFLRRESGDTFFARLTPAGEADISAGPKVWAKGPDACRDAQGGIWLAIEDPKGRKVVDGDETGITIRRITGPDRGQDFPGVSRPELVDDSGCVWLSPHTGNGGGTVTLWVPSGKTTTVNIPGRSSGSPLVAAGKGRVFAVTKAGLQELVADHPDQPETYTLGKLYALGVDGEADVGRLQYSSLGYLVTGGLKKKDRFVTPVLRLFRLDRLPAESGDAGATKVAGPEASSDASAAPASPAAGNLRTWQDSSGRFSVQAEFVAAEAGIVLLRKADGSTIKVPQEKLSAKDQQYLRSR